MAPLAAGLDLRVRRSQELLRRQRQRNAMVSHRDPDGGGVMVRPFLVANTAEATPRRACDALERRAEDRSMKVHFF